MVALAKIPVWMSVEEFLAWEPGDGQRWQLVDGEPQAMAPANRTHGTLQNQLGYLLESHFVAANLQCTAIANPGLIPHVLAKHNFRIPELAVTCSTYEAEETAVSDPILVVEVLSPSNQSATWANVWAYTSIPSVREILVLRSATIGAEVLRRNTDGSWPKEPESLTGGDLVLESVGFRVKLADVYRTTRLRQPQPPVE